MVAPENNSRKAAERTATMIRDVVRLCIVMVVLVVTRTKGFCEEFDACGLNADVLTYLVAPGLPPTWPYHDS
jgi:uncharacterized membrane protein